MWKAFGTGPQMYAIEYEYYVARYSTVFVFDLIGR